MDFRGTQSHAVKSYDNNGIGMGVSDVASATESLLARSAKTERAYADADMLANRAVDLLNEAQETLKFVDGQLKECGAKREHFESERARCLDLIERLASNAKVEIGR